MSFDMDSITHDTDFINLYHRRSEEEKKELIEAIYLRQRSHHRLPQPKAKSKHVGNKSRGKAKRGSHPRGGRGKQFAKIQKDLEEGCAIVF